MTTCSEPINGDDAVGVSAACERFVVEGSRNGSNVRVVWCRGDLSGDFPTIDLIETEAQLLTQQTGDRVSKDFTDGLEVDPSQELLAHPKMAFAIVERVLDRVRSVTTSAIDDS